MAEIDVRQLPQLWNTACACMKNKDYVNAAKLMKVLSCEGYSEAQYYLGTMYLNGLAVEKNLAEAFRLLNSAAHNGHAAAQCRLAGMYASGTHVAKDVLAAEQGNANAKAMLEKNKNPKAYTATLQESAVRATRALAEKGHPYAMYITGSVYKLGVTVSKNSAEAQQWYQKAFPLMKKLTEQGEAEAQMHLFQMYRHGDGVAEDEKEDWRWLNAAAENGYAEAQETLGMNYHTMRPRNEKEAIRWWTLAARQGSPLAQFFLSCDKGYEEEKFWLTRSAEQGGSVALNKLGGNCSPWYISEEEAAYWKEKAQKQTERAFIEWIDL